MFKFIDKPEALVVCWPCVVNVPRDGGNVVKAACTVNFELIDQTEIDAVVSSGGDEDLLDRVVKGWGADVADEQGNPLPFTVENKEKLLKITWVRAGWVAGFFQAASGKAAQRKN